MKAKSINDLVTQLHKFKDTTYFFKAYTAYNKSFYSHFGFYPHSRECSLFVNKFGKDFKL